MQIDPITVTASEIGITRLYKLDVPADEMDAFQEATNGIAPMTTALGAISLDADHVDIFDMAQLDSVGLAQFLRDGNGIDPDDLAPYHDMFATLTGPVMVVYSQAFGGQAQTLAPKAPLRFLAAFAEKIERVKFEPLPDGGALGAVEDPPAKKRPSDAAMGGRVATVALLVMAFLVWLMIKIAS